MKKHSYKINIGRLFIGVGYSTWAATKVSIVVSIIAVLAFAAQTNLTNLISGFFGGLFILLLFGGLISFFTALIIGIPVTIFLIKTGLDDELLSAVIGAMIVVMYCLYKGESGNFVLFLMVYGFFCAGGFMKGYKNK